MCVYIYIYISIHMCVYTYIYIYIYIYPSIALLMDFVLSVFFRDCRVPVTSRDSQRAATATATAQPQRRLDRYQ